jgi:hypothetical protein
VNVITTGERKIQTSRNNDIGKKKSWRVNAKVVEKYIDRRQARLLEEKIPPWNGAQDNRQTSNSEGGVAQRKAAWALKAGIGRTSGLGEFWNLELAQKSFLRPIGVEAAEAMRRRTGKSALALSSPEALDGEKDELSSSMDRLKTPSLGKRECSRLRSGV